MLISPSEEDKRMSRILDPWLMFDGQRFILKEGAPKEAVDMYKIYEQKYGKNFNSKQIVLT